MSNQIHAIEPVPLLDTKAAAGFLRVSKGFLDKSRVKGDGPPFAKIGRRVCYRLPDIHEWVAGRRRTSTSECRP